MSSYYYIRVLILLHTCPHTTTYSTPAAFKGKVLAAFFMAVPIGQAIGYAYGGFMCSSLDPEALGFAGTFFWTTKAPSTRVS